MLIEKQNTDDLRKSYRGRLAFEGLVRGLYSTDASPFQITPLGKTSYARWNVRDEFSVFVDEFLASIGLAYKEAE